jgi:hypothetical protein
MAEPKKEEESKKEDAKPIKAKYLFKDHPAADKVFNVTVVEGDAKPFKATSDSHFWEGTEGEFRAQFDKV